MSIETKTHVTAFDGRVVSRHFPPLASETRPAVDTATAAHWLLRKEQTLRCWACLETGPMRPMRVHGRLAWPVKEIRRVLGMTQ